MSHFQFVISVHKYRLITGFKLLPLERRICFQTEETTFVELKKNRMIVLKSPQVFYVECFFLSTSLEYSQTMPQFLKI